MVTGALAPLAMTVMFIEGLPGPHLAVTLYVPGATEATAAVPVKFSEPRLIVACPPTKAVEKTPLSGCPLVGQTPRRLTVSPAVAVPGFTIS